MEEQQRPPRRAASGRDHRNHTQHPRHGQGKKGGAGFILKTLVLIVLCTGVVFTGIFAVYVATCVIPDAHVGVSEISMDQSSVIFYENSEGEWEELETLHGGKNSIWADYETMPKLSLIHI